MTIVIKEILVKTRIEKTVYPPDHVPLEILDKLKQDLLDEMVKRERRKSREKPKTER